LGLQTNSFTFSIFFGLSQLIFPPKMCHVSLTSICHFLVLDPRLKALGPI
jgi:branched-subunit amino acid permease